MSIWRTAGLLEALIIYSRDAGRAANQEILSLIKHGFADGAHARWRAIHKTAAVAMFIRLSGHETAKRFLLHSIIDDYHLAKSIRKYPICAFHLAPPVRSIWHQTIFRTIVCPQVQG